MDDTYICTIFIVMVVSRTVKQIHTISTDPSLEPEDSDVTSDEDTEDTPNLSSHDTPNPDTLSKDTKDTSSLTALLQSRPGKSHPEASSTMEPMVEERLPTPPKPAADQQAPSSELSNSGLPQVKSSPKDAKLSAEKLDTDAKIKGVDSESGPEKSGPEKPKGLKDLLTAGVEDKYNADGSPVQVEAGNEDMTKVSCSW